MSHYGFENAKDYQILYVQPVSTLEEKAFCVILAFDTLCPCSWYLNQQSAKQHHCEKSYLSTLYSCIFCQKWSVVNPHPSGDLILRRNPKSVKGSSLYLNSY